MLTTARTGKVLNLSHRFGSLSHLMERTNTSTQRSKCGRLATWPPPIVVSKPNRECSMERTRLPFNIWEILFTTSPGGLE
jgi:hypothetical protein